MIFVAGVRANYEEVDIPFLSKLKFELKDLSKSTQCAFLAIRIKEKVETDTEDVLVKVRGVIERMDSLTEKALIEYLNECIEEERKRKQVRQSYSWIATKDASRDLSEQQSITPEDVSSNAEDEPVANVELSRFEGSARNEAQNEIKGELDMLREKEAELELLRRKLEQLEEDMRRDVDILMGQLIESRKAAEKIRQEQGKSAEAADLSEQNLTRISDLTKANEDAKRDLMVCLDDKISLINEFNRNNSESDRIRANLKDELHRAELRAISAENDKNKCLKERNDVILEKQQLIARFGMCQPFYHDDLFQNEF